VLASGFCFSIGLLLVGTEAGGLVRARRSSSGGCEFLAGGGGESRVGGGDSRVGSGDAASGLLRGGWSTLLIGAAAGLEELRGGTLGSALPVACSPD